MSGVGHSWDVFTTDSPYTAVLEGLPTQFALASRRIGFAVPGNLAAFLDDFEYTESQIDQTVSEADTTTVSAYTSGDPKRRRIGKSSPLLPFRSSILHSSSIPSSEVIASVTSIEDKMSISGASLPFASKDNETSSEMWSQVKEERDRRGIEGAVERREHEGLEEILEISGGLGPPCKRRLRPRLGSSEQHVCLVGWISLGYWLHLWRMSLQTWNSRLQIFLVYLIYCYRYSLFFFLSPAPSAPFALPWSRVVVFRFGSCDCTSKANGETYQIEKRRFSCSEKGIDRGPTQ